MNNLKTIDRKSYAPSLSSKPEDFLDILDFQNRVKNLALLRRETEWLELKHNNANPHEIGEYISALSNGAALAGRHSAYIL
jgi:ATP-dependent DNA helicase RecG